jgi:hypothetical protein
MSSSDTGNHIILENAKMRGHSVNRYKTIRSLYIGVSGNSDVPYKSDLTPAQLAEGRKRAKSYYTKRNIRVYTQISVLIILTLALLIWLFWFFLF